MDFGEPYLILCVAGKISEFDILAAGGRRCSVCSDNKGTFGQKLSILGRFAVVFTYESKLLLEKSEIVFITVGNIKEIVKFLPTLFFT